MTPCRVALVAEDASQVEALAESVQHALGQPVLVHSFASIRELLDRDADGLLVLVRRAAADSQAAKQLVQDIALQKLLPLVVLLDCGSPVPANDDLDRYV